MKKTLLILLCFPLLTLAQQTYVPDDNFEQVSFKIHPGAFFIKDDLCEIVIGASISFQKENLIYSLEFYSANEVGLFLPDPPQYFNQLGVLIGKKKKYKRINIGNLKTLLSNKKIRQSVSGNTNTVYINPLNSLRFVLNKLKKDKINLNKDFYIFTGSTVGVVPILGKGLYEGKVESLGSAKAIIY